MLKKVKGTILFSLSVAIILLLLFMIFGSIVLLLEFGATRDSLIFLGVSILISIPGIIYLVKMFKKLMGTY